MTRRLLLSYLTITAFVLLILEIPLGISFASGEEDRLLADLERDARVIATIVEDVLEGTSDTDLGPVVAQYRERTGDGRVVVVDADGIGAVDSDDPDGPPRDFSTRPEIRIALTEGAAASGTRRSETLDEDLVYVAVPVASGGRILGAVRVTFPRTELDDRIRRNWLALGLLALVVLVAVAIVGTILARSVTRPLRDLSDAATTLAGGDLGARVGADRGPPEVRELGERFDAMAEQLEVLVASQRDFVADASHELRTPLTALRLRLDNLERVVPAALRGDVEAARAEADRLGRLVDGLLALARTEGDRPDLVTLDLAAAAGERVAMWRALADEQSVDLVLEVPRAAPVRATPGALEQVLDNLLANALEVAPAGSRVVVAVRPGPAGAELHVVDEGHGLGAGERRRAFDRFWRGPGAAPGGSGLGLAIVARLVRLAGGSARMDAAPDGGVDVVVALPAPDP